MDNFLQKIKLSDELITELDISTNDFITAFEKNVDKSDLGLFSNSFEVFSSSKNGYKGNISYDGFKIRRRRRFYSRNASGAIGVGTFSQQNGKLIIHTEISNNKQFIYIFSLLAVMYAFIFGIFLFVGQKDEETYFVAPFILAHAALMFAIFYFVMRRSVSNLKYDLEREFFYWTKK